MNGFNSYCPLLIEVLMATNVIPTLLVFHIAFHALEHVPMTLGVTDDPTLEPTLDPTIESTLEIPKFLSTSSTQSPSVTPSLSSTEFPYQSDQSINKLCNDSLWNIIAGTWTFDPITCSLDNIDISNHSQGLSDIIWFGSSDGMTPNHQFCDESFSLSLTFAIHSGRHRVAIAFRAKEIPFDEVDENGGEYYLIRTVEVSTNNKDRIQIGMIDNGEWTKKEGWVIGNKNTIGVGTVHNLTLEARSTSYSIYFDGDLELEDFIMSEYEDFNQLGIGFGTSSTNATFYSLTYNPIITTTTPIMDEPTMEPTLYPTTISTLNPTTIPTLNPIHPTNDPTNAPSNSPNVTSSSSSSSTTTLNTLNDFIDLNSTVLLDTATTSSWSDSSMIAIVTVGTILLCALCSLVLITCCVLRKSGKRNEEKKRNAEKQGDGVYIINASCPRPRNVIPDIVVSAEEDDSTSSADRNMEFQKEGESGTRLDHDAALHGSNEAGNNDILAMPDYDNAVSVDAGDIQLTDSVVKVRVESEMSDDRESVIVTPGQETEQ